MTKQETFDKVVNHLRKQGAKAEGEIYGTSRQCIYWDRNTGRKCAAGCLIPEDKYDPKFETKSVKYEEIRNIIEDEGHDLYLVRCLQWIHDDRDILDWEVSFMALANSLGLEYSEREKSC